MSLLSGYILGDLALSNRMVMAPMTRCRAIRGNVPGPLTVTYYRQRASAGLIITEGSQVSPMGVGFSRTPGIHSLEQVTGWKEVTGAVHMAGGRIFLQLWHVGRMSHPDYLGGALPVAPSALPVGEEIHTPTGAKKAIPVPRALGTDEIPGIIDQFRTGAVNAKAAGFDGVEIHGANGYLLDQFLRDGANRRTDAYGGSVENRVRLPLEVAGAVARAFGGNRVGYRISPHFLVHGMTDSNPRETFSCLVEGLGRMGIGYVHLVESLGGRTPVPPAGNQLASIIRTKFDGALMLNGGYNEQSATAAIEEGAADLIAFGIPFLANPDLPERFRQHAVLNHEDIATFYDGEEKGYTDYPALRG
jgi:N-ethylmaleimide reductase